MDKAQAISTAFIYARVSTETQVERGLGLAVQLQTCRDYCEAEGIEVEGEYVDEAVSGATVDRDGLQDMLADLNGVTWVVVANTSRLWRDIYPQAIIQKTLKDLGKDIKSVEQPTFTLYTDEDPNNALVNSIMCAIDIWDRQQITMKLRRARRKKASNGQKASGNAPFGYCWVEKRQDGKREKVVEPAPTEASQVQEIFKSYLRLDSNGNVSLGILQKVLTSAEIYNRRGKAFSRQALLNILKNDFYVGVVRHHKVKTEGTHNPLVTRITFGKVQKALARNSKK
jgi:DNA invertase Pin-like site-specific DNA recombinase